MLLKSLTGVPLLALALVRHAHADADSDSDAQRHERRQPEILPLAVRKMGLDEGEKFYPQQYYGFELDTGSDAGDTTVERARARRAASTDGHGRSLASLFSLGRRAPGMAVDSPSTLRRDAGSEHGTMPLDLVMADVLPRAYLPPFSVHQDARDALDALARLQQRAWSCPAGTASCNDIGYPYSCCSAGETCYAIIDTGLGPVGCCPTGSTCGGAVSSCASGSTACAASLGGGCCIEGYACAGVGCVKIGSSSAASTSTTSTTSTSTSTSSPSTTSTTTSTTTTTTSGVAAAKPTGTDTALPSGYCPTGYYACLAVAGGGCCQTGRDCQTTSCPPAAPSTTLVNTNGITVVVPASDATEAAAATTSATCAAGWFLCGASAGPVAGCCPTGYGCGTASCTMTSASATATVQKVRPSSSSSSAPVVSVPLFLTLAPALALAIAALAS